MTRRAIDDVLDYSKSKYSDRAVLIALASHANEDGFAWPGIGQIMRRAAVGRSTAWHSLQNLCQRGDIARYDGPVPGREHAVNTITYRILVAGSGLSAPDDAGASLQDLDSETPDDDAPSLQDLDSERPNEAAPSLQDLDSERPNEAAPSLQDLDSQRPNEAAPSLQDLDSQQVRSSVASPGSTQLSPDPGRLSPDPGLTYRRTVIEPNGTVNAEARHARARATLGDGGTDDRERPAEYWENFWRAECRLHRQVAYPQDLELAAVQAQRAQDDGVALPLILEAIVRAVVEKSPQRVHAIALELRKQPIVAGTSEEAP